jgi:hypothetical protein
MLMCVIPFFSCIKLSQWVTFPLPGPPARDGCFLSNRTSKNPEEEQSNEVSYFGNNQHFLCYKDTTEDKKEILIIFVSVFLIQKKV